MASMREILAQKAQEIKDERNSNLSTYKFPEGTTYFTILPLHGSEDGVFWHDCGIHWIKDHKGNTKTTAPDMIITKGEARCLVREGIEELRDKAVTLMAKAKAEGNRTEFEEASKAEGFFKESLAKNRPLVGVQIIKYNEVSRAYEKEGEPVIVDFPKTAFDNLIQACSEKIKFEEDKILRWNDRAVFSMNKSGKGKETRYLITPAEGSINLDPKIMSKAVNIKEYIDSLPSKTTAALKIISFIKGEDTVAEYVPAETRPARAIAPPIVVEDEVEVVDEIEDVPFEVRSDSPAAIKAAASPSSFLDSLDDL